jgi:hypothetical protein
MVRRCLPRPCQHPPRLTRQAPPNSHRSLPTTKKPPLPWRHFGRGDRIDSLRSGLRPNAMHCPSLLRSVKPASQILIAVSQRQKSPHFRGGILVGVTGLIHFVQGFAPMLCIALLHFVPSNLLRRFSSLSPNNKKAPTSVEAFWSG